MMKALAGLVSPEASLLGLHLATLPSPCPPVALVGAFIPGVSPSSYRTLLRLDH